jgi:hypothetical protein
MLQIIEGEPPKSFFVRRLSIRICHPKDTEWYAGRRRAWEARCEAFFEADLHTKTSLRGFKLDCFAQAKNR